MVRQTRCTFPRLAPCTLPLPPMPSRTLFAASSREAQYEAAKSGNVRPVTGDDRRARNRKTLEPGATERITFNSTTPRAADFQMDLRYSR